MAENPEVKKSKNFDTNLDSARMQKQAKKNVYKITSLTQAEAEKLMPIATRATITSSKLEKKGDSIILSSLNWQNVAGTGMDRYNYKKSNGQYKIKGKLVPAGKNAGKYRWYHRGADNVKDKMGKATEGVIK